MTASSGHNCRWTWIVPVAAWLSLLGTGFGGYFLLVSAVALIGGILAAVHHAEVIALRVGEPLGALVLALAVTIIEVALLLSLMISGGTETATLMRDAIFATVMLILNGIVGFSLLLGGIRHNEQTFDTRGVSSTLAVLAVLTVLTLVLPNYTTSVPGPYYTRGQLEIVAVLSIVLYATFIVVQTVRYRTYFIPQDDAPSGAHELTPPSPREAGASALLLFVSLGAVVLLAHAIAPVLEHLVAAAGAPKATVGVIIAAVVLLPEATAALRAAVANRIQISLNLALGSALASMALTLPVIAFVSLAAGWPLALGLDGKSTVLLSLSLLVSTVALSTGRTMELQGCVLLVILIVYLATTLIP
jgi:Ca2+:H+ antiporter